LNIDHQQHDQQRENVNKESIQIYQQFHLCHWNFQRFHTAVGEAL